MGSSEYGEQATIRHALANATNKLLNEHLCPQKSGFYTRKKAPFRGGPGEAALFMPGHLLIGRRMAKADISRFANGHQRPYLGQNTGFKIVTDSGAFISSKSAKNLPNGAE
ncbi:hypothetical protein EHV15_12180 [Paenibacillus oralis]|uniref:Uncharacterized protein n=1 Tax=Paenibacillus oralis TaxID=2490856 RepID=A0A3P3TZQ2_9BACL|nr:hypothetical protein [Paenibacillus oralis]RRJ63601.1 hypothetical protein EHV15_12180 [Paenibacillus oralis]